MESGDVRGGRGAAGSAESKNSNATGGEAGPRQSRNRGHLLLLFGVAKGVEVAFQVAGVPAWRAWPACGRLAVLCPVCARAGPEWGQCVAERGV